MYFIRDPEYGKDYKDGFIFFSYNTSSFISAGIALFSRKEALNGVPISHCGLITGEHECIEATQPGGVQISDFVKKYIKPNQVIVFLCKPTRLTPEIAKLMEEKAKTHIGKGYSSMGVAGSAIWNILGLTWIPWFRRRRNWFNSKSRMFCSELCAESLIDGYPDRPGCLQWHPTNIYPATLFNDRVVFDKWSPLQHLKRKRAGRIVVNTDFQTKV